MKPEVIATGNGTIGIMYLRSMQVPIRRQALGNRNLRSLVEDFNLETLNPTPGPGGRLKIPDKILT